MITNIDSSQKSPKKLLQKRIPISPVIRKFSRPILFKNCQPNETTFTSIHKQFSNSFKISHFSMPPLNSFLKPSQNRSNHESKASKTIHLPCSSPPYHSQASKSIKSSRVHLFSSPSSSSKVTSLRSTLKKPQNLVALSKTLKPKYINLEISQTLK